MCPDQIPSTISCHAGDLIPLCLPMTFWHDGLRMKRFELLTIAIYDQRRQGDEEIRNTHLQSVAPVGKYIIVSFLFCSLDDLIRRALPYSPWRKKDCREWQAPFRPSA